MHRMISGGIVAVACTLLAPACDDGGMCACTFPPPGVEGFFRGMVFSPDSVGVDGAIVTVEAGVASCDVQDEGVYVTADTSRQGGFYESAAFMTDFDTDALCIRVYALPPDATDYAPSDAVELALPDIPEVGPLELDFYLNP